MKIENIKRVALQRAEMYISDPIDLKRVSIDGNIDTNDLGSDISLTPYAFNQLLEKLKVKTAYGEIRNKFGQSESQSDLLQDILDFGVSKRGSRSSLCLIQNPNTGKVHGVVGKGYNLCKHIDVLEAVENAVERRGYSLDNVDERFSTIGELGMCVMFTTEMEKTSIGAKEAIGFGSCIWNGDVGGKSLGWRQFFIFMRCDNGLLVKDTFSEKIIAHTKPKIMELFSKSFDNWLKPNEIERFMLWVDKAYEKPEILDEPSLIPQFLKGRKIRKDYREGILRFFLEQQELPLNPYGIGNAVNGYASNILDNPQDSEELMLIAANIMGMGVTI